jgi:hypothetical protein
MLHSTFLIVSYSEINLTQGLYRNRVAQAVQCMTTDWNTGRSVFDPRQRPKDFSSSLCVQTGSGAHPASCTMGTGGPFPGAKRGRGVTLTTHPHLVPKSGMSRSYTSSPPNRVAGLLCKDYTAIIKNAKLSQLELTMFTSEMYHCVPWVS